MRVSDHEDLAVNIATGVLNISATDYTKPGRNGFDMAFTRNWTSVGGNELGDVGDWETSYREAKAYHDATAEVIVAPDGTPYTFTPQAGGTFASPPGLNATLTKTRITTGAVSQTWTLTFTDGQSWVFQDRNTGSTELRDEGYLAWTSDRNNNRVTSTWDTSNGALIGNGQWPRLTGVTDSFGTQPLTLNYNGYGLSSISSDGTAVATYNTTYISGGYGRLNSVTAPGGTTTYTYTNGEITQITSPAGRIIKIAYNGGVSSVTQVTNVTAGTGPTWNFGRTAPNPDAGNIGNTYLTDPNNVIVTYQWDARGRVTKTTDGRGFTTEGVYSPAGRVTSVQAATGGRTNSAYNSAGDPTSVQAPGLTSSTPNSGRTATAAYNNSAHPHQPSTMTDTQGHQTTFAYDPGGNTTSSTNASSALNTTTLAYNPDGTVASASNPMGTATSYTYTGGRLTKVDHPGSQGDETLTYDSKGRIATATDGRGKVTTYTYDAFNRVLTSKDNANNTITYTYDADGNLTGRTDPTGSYTFGYDAIGQQTSRTFPSGTGSGTLTNTTTYDAAGNKKTVTDANGTVTYNYDAANNVTSLVMSGALCTGTAPSCTTSFTYNADNKRVNTNYPNGVTQTFYYDRSGRTEYVTTMKGSTTLVDLAYIYTDNGGADTGLLQAVVDDVGKTYTKYSYDELNRLTETHTFNGTDQEIGGAYYVYDAAGNRTASYKSGDSNTAHWAYNSSNQLTGKDNNYFQFTYDTAGNLTSTTNGYGYSATANDRGQLTTINGVAQTYAGEGQSERVSSGVTLFRYRTDGEIASTQSPGQPSQAYVLDPNGVPIAQKTGAGLSYFLYDRLGSTIALIDTSGAIVRSFSYGNFGEVLGTAGTVSTQIQYAGGWSDGNGSLYKFGERYYNPNNATWTQRDTYAGTITNPKEMNRYAYVGGDPINYTDPSGLFSIGDAVTVVAGTVAGGVAAAAVGAACAATAPVCLAAAVGAGAVYGGTAAGIARGVTGGSQSQVRTDFIGGAIGGGLSPLTGGARFPVVK